MLLKHLPIEQTVDLDLNYPPPSERYYEHFYFIPINIYKKTRLIPESVIRSSQDIVTAKRMGEAKMVPLVEVTAKGMGEVDKVPLEDTGKYDFTPNGEDTCIMVHSNRLCVITLSPRHPVLVNKKTITKVDFNASGVDRLANKVSGKGKRGAQVVGLFSPLCLLGCSDGSSYTVAMGMRGKLTEVNERLVENPNLITESPTEEGYLGVVLPRMTESDKFSEYLFTREEYNKLYLKYEKSESC